ELLARDRLSVEDRREYDYLENIRSHNLSMIASAKDEGRFEYESLLAEKERIIAEKERLLAEREQIIARERAEKERALAKLAALKNDERK
ncbi:MAG: hypothetical protein LBD52_08305, partial [Prevotellaceae bacterium]|nr:hypothetical protein [Prevotellaceae bacterium]